ncbi:hypothetical protein FKM82_030413, partial [Ascaphus truei]
TLGWAPSVRKDLHQETVVYEQDGEVQLLMQCKRFECQNGKMFQETGERSVDTLQLHKFDSEPLPFLSELTEIQISFPPSYPFSESVERPSEFMRTRCPAWCDRVFMSHSASALFHKVRCLPPPSSSSVVQPPPSSSSVVQPPPSSSSVVQPPPSSS